MRALRIVAIVFGFALIGLEFWRNLGGGRPFLFQMDEIVVGALLVISAMRLNPDTTRRRAFFTGAWALSLGVLFESLSRQVSAPQTVDPGNFTMSQLTLLLCVALLVAFCGTAAAILQPRGA